MSHNPILTPEEPLEERLRKNAKLREAVVGWLMHPVCREILLDLRLNKGCPAELAKLALTGVTESLASYALGLQAGYHQCLSDLQNLVQPDGVGGTGPGAPDVEMSYGRPAAPADPNDLAAEGN